MAAQDHREEAAAPLRGRRLHGPGVRVVARQPRRGDRSRQGKNDYHVSSGLSRPDFYDWPQRLVDQIVDFKPDAAAVLFGANDGQDVLYEGKVLKVGTKAWQEVYAQRVGEAMDILTKGGRRVYWIGNPIMKDFGYRQRIAMMNHIYEAEAKKHPGVTFVSTWATMANEKGSYAEYLKTRTATRS